MCTASGTCTYTPAAGYSGTDSFTYELSDGVNVTVSGFGGVAEAVASGTVSITVTAAASPAGGPAGTPSGGLPAAGAAIARTMMIALGLSAAGLVLRRRSHRRPRSPFTFGDATSR